MNNILKITFNQLPKHYQAGIVFCLFATFLSFIILFFTKVKSINAQEISLDINKFNKINTPAVKPAFFVITPYVTLTKNNFQILPYYLWNRLNMYSILEACWWSEYTLWKKERKWIIPNFVLGLRFLANAMAFGMIYVIIFWYFGVAEFQNLDFIGIVFVMFLWVFFFGAITTTYIHQKITNYLSYTKQISKEDSVKIRWCAAWFWIWPIANVVLEHVRFVLWIFNYVKYKKIAKKDKL